MTLSIEQTSMGISMPTQLPLEVSVIVPALNEAENLKQLLPRIHTVLRFRRYEVIVVDDNSRDGTEDVCCEAAGNGIPVRLIVREQPRDGLSGAVLAGMAAANGEVLVVMDADLQHPPETLPQLIRPLEEDEADFTLGSRYVPGASSDERWGLGRRINSWVATFLARPFAGRTSDPMSGFFALRRQTYLGAQRLTPLGYKIGLELMCKARVKRVHEVPIHFGLRAAGESKLTLKQQFKYLEHLSRLYDFCYPRLSPVTKFTIVTMIAWLVGLAAFLVWLNRVADLAVATSIGYAASLGVVLVFFMRYVRTQREFIPRRRPWIDFTFTSLAEWAGASLAAAYLATRLAQPHPLEVFLLAFTVGTTVRYICRKEFLQDLRGLRRDLREAENQ